MNRTRLILFGSVVGAALVFGGAVGAFAARTNNAPASNVLAAITAASPSPTPHSNEATTHEAGESAAQETAENNGTFHPGGGAGPNGTSNETSAHEAGESATREASEKS
jgi:hypothetical protein